jgi:hypothetical protein
LRGWELRSESVIRSSARSPGIWASGRPVRVSSALKLSTAILPLVVPDRARIVSQASTSRSSRGRPSAGPPPLAVPLRRRSSSTSAAGF